MWQTGVQARSRATAEGTGIDSWQIRPGGPFDRIHVKDLRATILKLLGLDHRKLTFQFEAGPAAH